MTRTRDGLDVLEAIQLMLNEDADSVRSQANDISGSGAAYYEGYIAHCLAFSAKLEKIKENLKESNKNG